MASQFDIPGYIGNKRVGSGTAAPDEEFSDMPTSGLPLPLVTQNLTSALHGELPLDVQNLLAQRAAEIGVGSGTSGSEFNKFRSLRDLGLTSLDRMDAATKMLVPNFLTQYQAGTLSAEQQRRVAAENEAYQGRVAAQNARAKPLSSETSAPLYQPRVTPTAPTSSGSIGRTMPSGTDPLTALIQEIGQKYGPGTTGGGGSVMAPMGQGTIPSYGGSWNAGPLTVGGGSFFAGDPSELSTEEQWQYGKVPGLTPEEQAMFTRASNPITADDADYLYGPA